MGSALRAHTIVHVKFMARSRMLLGFAMLIVLGSSIALVPAFFLNTASNRFDLLKDVAGLFHGVVSILTGGIGLLLLWSHRRDRTIKLIATKPSPFEEWVASVFLSAAMVGLAAHAIVALLTFVLSLYWGVPYQIGFLYLAADRFVASLIILACLTTLSALVHPSIAIVVALLFNESTFMSLGTWAAAAIESGWASAPLRVAQRLLMAAYYVVPTFRPFSDKTSMVRATLRVAAIDWRYLAGGAAYALLAATCGYLLTLAVLRRTRLT